MGKLYIKNKLNGDSMYKKYHRSDELFTSVSLSFSLLLLDLFLIYDKVINNLTGDMDFYFYVSIGTSLFLTLVYTIVLFIMNYNYKKVDIGIDFKQECIYLQNGKKTVQFSDIQLFGYNKNIKDVRLLIEGELYGFLLSSVVNEKEEPVNEEQILLVGSYTKTVKHQHLYNYNLIITILMVVTLFMYAFLNEGFAIFGLPIATFYMFIFFTLVYLTVDQINRYRYRRLLVEEQMEIEIEEEKSDTF